METGTLELHLDRASAPVGSLQFQIDYANSGAIFTHEAGANACVPNRDAARWMYWDCDFRPVNDLACEVSPGFHPGEMQAGFVTLEPPTAPLLLATCRVSAENLAAAVHAMLIEPIEMTSGDLEPIEGQVSMRLVPD